MRNAGCALLIFLAMRSEARAAAVAQADLAAMLATIDAANPEVLAADARWRASPEVPERLQALPQPKLSVVYTNDTLDDFTLGDSEFSNLTVGWEQEVPPRGARNAASGVARADAEIARLTIETLRARLRARVITLYADLYRIDRTRALVEESRGVLSTEIEASRARYEAGQGTQESLLRAQVELRRTDLMLEELSSGRREAAAALNEALGRSPETEIGVAPGLPQAAIPDARALEDGKVAPTVREAEGRSARAEAAITDARSRNKPEFSWLAAYQYRGSLDPMVMGGFGVRLPVWKNRDQARSIAEREAERDAARHDADAAGLRTRTQALSLWNEAGSAERRLRIYRDALIPEDAAALEAARASYGAGRSDMGSVFGALARILADRRDAIALDSARIQKLAALEAVTGLPIIDANRVEVP